MKPYPTWTCKECGLKHGSGQRAVSIWYFGKCDVCEIHDVVTQPQDFGGFKNWNNYGNKRILPSLRDQLA